MGKRHETIGIKQAIRFEWMQKTASLLLAGLDAKTIRQELHEFLVDRKGNGSEGERSDQTRTFVVNNLMKIWGSPDSELIPFRDASLAFLRENPSMALAVHWGMISAVYPFWFNVARQTGRLLEEVGLVRFADFRDVVTDPDFLRHYGIPFATAEGFLMPDTYLLKKTDEPDDA